ncbi:MbcA/ParS/Xre antitoxin family protein [Rhizobium sp. CSW-27]|uniref:MbcA/ParS/Xre antitoxin family protein n=1 Tax=Rhizobium sp. CSW-27 TaxID=2839985 RepID=UPI001C01B6F3|nr:MbcA/ParS/Xre antitoxin family protein [Rhizobium sp. CSW-27]MBT9368682.1 MbcA/ParS/Xre antitoxin family protein [Rhizobium sp. CSW-27]
MNMHSPSRADPAAEGAVVSKAVMKAAERLGISGRALGGILGLSEASVSRLKRAELTLSPGEKSFELALLFIRLFRSLDAITGGDETVAKAWLRNENTALGGIPLDKIITIAGLIDVLAYLDARRALV